MEENTKFKKAIKRSIVFFIITLIVAMIGLIILRYHVEGEQNMPFNLSQVMIVSSAEGVKKETKNKENWNVDIYQTNDIYINIKKSKNYKDEEIIKSIEIKNINVVEKPLVGNVSIYIPKGESLSYEYINENMINNEIIYEGDTKSDLENFKLSNQGGTIIFRIVNNTQKEYISNEEELKHDGTLLNKVGLLHDDIKFKISFDIVINLESEITFTGNIELELPVKDITTNGMASLDKNNTKDIIFKRE